MCGLVCYVNSDRSNLLENFKKNLNHRGPDQSGEYNDQINSVYFSHNRLKILDLETGEQPMCDQEKNIIISYNGEIFNHREIRKELMNRGCKFQSRDSDTETILNLYKVYGVEGFKKLNGMFAFVIYDKLQKYLVAVRDQFGIKPLYYVKYQNEIYFFSEIRAVLGTNILRNKNIDLNSLNYYFNLQYIPSTKTIYEDIKKVNQGEYCIYDLSKNELNFKKYYSLNLINKNISTNKKEILENLNYKIENAIKSWTQSDVPISLSLSGGLDSSIIALLLKKLNINYNSYTLTFDNGLEKNYDLENSKLITKICESNHKIINIDSRNLFNDLDDICKNLSEPYAGSLASWYIYKNIRNEKVVLTGTGADELFGNYGKWLNYEFSYKTLRKFFNKQKFFDKKNISLFGNFPGNYDYIFSAHQLNSLLKNKEKNFFDAEELLINLRNQFEGDNIKDLVKYLDFNTQLPDEFLYVTDRFSMSFSIEARTPFLDRELVEYIFSLPSKFNGKFYNSKNLLKETFSEILPKEIINSPKQGFTLPINIWLKKELLDQLKYFSSKDIISKQNIFNYQYINNLINYFIKNDFSTEDITTKQVWTFFIFQKWYFNWKII